MRKLFKDLQFNGRKTVLASVTALAFALSAGQGVAQERVGDFALLYDCVVHQPSSST